MISSPGIEPYICYILNNRSEAIILGAYRTGIYYAMILRDLRELELWNSLYITLPFIVGALCYWKAPYSSAQHIRPFQR